MPNKKILIVGGVAAGTKAAAKCRREDPNAEITVVTKDQNVSYAGCGLPYYIGGAIQDRAQLLARTVDELTATLEINIHVNHEAVSCDTAKKTVRVVNLADKSETEMPYDALVIATGAAPIPPRGKGAELGNIFTLRDLSDTDAIKALVVGGVKNAVIVGGGYIGLEMAEAMHANGAKTTVVELMDHILPNFDGIIALLAQKHLREKGVEVITGEKVVEFKGDSGVVAAVVTDKGKEIPADIVVWSVGVRPCLKFAKTCGVKIGVTGAIEVNKKMQTSVPDIYAAGDCAQSVNILTGKPAWIPLGSTANKMGRVAALNICGIEKEFPGVLASSIVKIFNLNAASTGLSVAEANEAGFDAESVILAGNDISPYYPGAKMILLKLVADRKTHRVLGASLIGAGVVDKPVNILVSCITLGATLEQISDMDFAYAPPFSTAMDMVITGANVLLNKMRGHIGWTNCIDVKKRIEAGEKIQILDCRKPEMFDDGHPAGAINIPWGQLYKRAGELNKDGKVAFSCKIGQSCYSAILILQARGHDNLELCEGGIAVYPYEVEKKQVEIARE